MAEPSIPVEAELTLFRSKLVGIKRRVSDRYRCALATSGKLYFPATGESTIAWVINLSVGGIGLNLSRTLEDGTELLIQLKVPEGNLVLKVPAHVVHTTPEVDGTYRIGCAFHEPISGDALDSLLYGTQMHPETV
jgi:hypothetical protein